ncbi:MAG: ABC transporter substrate-binding protein [Deltaproteobacteria bacterium]|nr:ABC transporter substrate-binding protein [Deltaproteobacteria bacterium]
MRRKHRLGGMAFGVALGVLCWSGAVAKEPIKVGFLASYVGVLAKIGQDMDRGFRLGLEEVGYTAGGRQLTMVTEDTEGKPELGPTKARKLIENEKVQLIAGIDHSGIGIAIRDIVTNAKIPTVITNAGAYDLTGKLKSPYIFRVSFANGQMALPMGWYAANKLGFKRMIIIAPDYSAGHEWASRFMKYFKESGGTIVEEIFAPLTTTDFAPYLAKIQGRAKEVDAVWAFFPGSGSIRLITQYEEYGLKGVVPLLSLGDTVEDSVLSSMKDAALGVKNTLHYAATLKTPENQKFVKAYVAKYKESPSMYSEQGYVGAKVITLALEAVKGDIDNQAAFLAALKKIKFNAPRGPISFDENQNVVQNVYVRQVERVDGKLINTVLDTIPNVDQDWSPAKLKK